MTENAKHSGEQCKIDFGKEAMKQETYVRFFCIFNTINLLKYSINQEQIFLYYSIYFLLYKYNITLF